MNLSPLQKLDKILGILIISKEKRASMVQILLDANDEITYNDFDIVTTKLIKDGYIERPYGFSNPESHTIYSLTFEGLIFYQKGGYIYYSKNEKRKNIKDTIYIWAVAIGTSLAGIYGLFEILKWVAHHFHLHLPF